jgi:anti-sigma28 factor (negative regulator of flagellin synthesis)
MIRNVDTQSNMALYNELKKNGESDKVKEKGPEAVRQRDRVEKIAEEIAQGTYRIDLRAVAEKMAEALKAQ